MTSWTTTASAVGAAFAASSVEIVEAFTIVLAVATVRGWRPALVGSGTALAVLALVVLALGPLVGQVPIHALQFVIGTLLMLFGLSWLRKAVLRAGGVIALHDEQAAFAEQSAALRGVGQDWIAGMTAFKAVLLEGIEVAFVVIAVGAGRGLLWPAAAGAALAALLVLAVGFAVHRPLARVPENALKFGVGVMLAAFGVFWVGEGAGLPWPGGDLVLPVFAGVFLATGLILARSIRQPE
ncbi:MAG: hypothetical protein H6895_06840 [Defluviimonas sp.]|uniref:COG4280 domain-containing protein n=1 Tax=Albidovulum sp. TaxID=1872424 RepID=UPI001E06B646|nr:hypothetical protein [Paracoccaceae bacterium]MCC0063788.1 hypothetical protein [Defluviimonas sp.]